MAKQDFGQLVGAHVRKYESRMLTVFRESAQDVIEEAQQPIGSGGNMPVRTSFLRNSGQAALNNTPSGQSIKPKDYAPGSGWDPNESLLVVNQAKIGDRIVFGWVANYSVFVEAKRGFLRLAVQNWNSIVKRNAERLRQRTTK